jgi:hypothetical protein
MRGSTYQDNTGVFSLVDSHLGMAIHAIAEGADTMAGLFEGRNGANALRIFGATCCDGAELLDYSVFVNNAAVGNASDGTGPDVLGLAIQGSTMPHSGMNFIGFFTGPSAGHLIGEIEGDGSGGVRYKGTVLELKPRSSAPPCVTGTIYYDLDDHTFCFCEGAAFIPQDGFGSCS